MRVLLDTHTLIWSLTDSRLLPLALRRALADRRNEVCFSAISLFEVSMKRSGKSRSAPKVGAERLVGLARHLDFHEVPVKSSHAVAMETVAPFHPDPFDRLLLAQAQVEGLQLVTHDERLASFDSRTILF